jgi:hypothetical protein
MNAFEEAYIADPGPPPFAPAMEPTLMMDAWPAVSRWGKATCVAAMTERTFRSKTLSIRASSIDANGARLTSAPAC